MNITEHLIPIHQWNKKLRGKERGKTPLHTNWASKEYTTTKKDVKKWASDGLNVGFRIPVDVVVIDVDPRNGGKSKVRRKLAKDLGYDSWDDVTASNHSVRTGGGGYHVYFRWPPDTDPANYREIDDTLYKGIEFKKKGRQVLVPKSKHPSGGRYEYITSKKKWRRLPDKVCNKIWREIVKRDTVGGGEFTGDQLGELLSHLDPADFSDNNKWEPILMAAHHATAGTGVDEFVAWSISDPEYTGHDREVRYRWDSLNAERNDGYTYRTLRRELEKKGVSTAGFEASKEFADYVGDDIEDGFEDNEELEHEHFVTESIDDDEVVAEALRIDKVAPPEELEVLLRKIRTLTGVTKERAIQNITGKGRPYTMVQFNRLMKAMQEQVIGSINLILAEHVIKVRFNEGKHIMVLADGSLWIYKKTHWLPIKDSFLRTLCLSSFERNRVKIGGDKQLNEDTVVSHAVQIIRDKVGKPDMRILDDTIKEHVINCTNGELWINKNGTHDFKKHSFESYLTACLPIAYDPLAKAPLWKKTLKEIFPHDTKAMVKYMGEVLGYAIGPNKKLAAWFLFRGEGGDGKSTVLKVVSKVLGKQGMLFAQVKILSLGSSNMGNNHATVDFIGKSIVAVEEVPVHITLDDSGLKLMSEPTEMIANPKGRDAFTFDYHGTLFMCANGYPKIRDISKAMERRANVIPFTQSFSTKGTADIHRIDNIVSTELPGVLNWLLAGLERSASRKSFKTEAPPPVVTATNRWVEDATHINAFIVEACERIPLHKKGAKASDLYTQYVRWCEISGIKPKQKPFFKQDLETLGYLMGTKQNTPCYMGLDVVSL